MADAPIRKVTVGVCGGIAAYRAVELVRLLQQAGFDPHVAITAAAAEFVTPLTFAAISGHRVITSLWTGAEVPEGSTANVSSGQRSSVVERNSAIELSSSIEHIQEARTTAALLLVPATADMLAKLAHGFAGDFLTTLYLATPAPVIIAPAMNVAMWQHPAVQANVEILRRRGHRIVEPEAGYLACGMSGAGRLAALPEIVAAVQAALTQEAALPAQASPRDLAHETILITAGGTREPIDSVRFLGNRSSGRMGYALAAEAVSRGARVLLVSANCALTVPPGAELIPVTTAAEMRAALLAALPRATMLLKAAAVADFRVAQPGPAKLHRAGSLTLTLEPTEDIVAEAVARKLPGTLVIAFAAEVADPLPADQSSPALQASPLRPGILERGREKLLRKGVDAILINDVSAAGLGFDSDHNAGTLLFHDHAVHFPPMSKREMAARILDEAVALRSRLAQPAPALTS
jgi:phosphopantothenoylcysteine decarboxylase/phosphopantothenate--cysteine ligase